MNASPRRIRVRYRDHPLNTWLWRTFLFTVISVSLRVYGWHFHYGMPPQHRLQIDYGDKFGRPTIEQSRQALRHVQMGNCDCHLYYLATGKPVERP